METVLINEFVKENGIFLKPELFSDFKNNKVQIIIRQINDSSENDNIMKFAGILNDNEANELSENIKECRTIDMESWQ